jgi:hypothetical protein
MRHTAIALALLLCLPAAAQGPRIDVGALKKFGAAATEQTEVSLDGMALRWALGDMADDPAARRLAKAIKEIYVHTFEFDADDKYSKEDFEDVRRQMIKTPPWKQVVGARSKKDGEDVSVFYLMDSKDREVRGMAVLALERREIAVINIVGSIDLEGLSKMKRLFGLPDIEDVGAGPE